MIGIQQLDNLSSNEMLDILDGKTKILVLDPRKIQTIVLEEIPKPVMLDDRFLPHSTVITLLKMELESRAGFAYLREKIEEREKKYT